MAMSNNRKSGLIPSLNLRRENTISDAFSAIDGRFGMVVIVVDANGRLCGIVSEGDLRRAILNGKPVTAPLEEVMNVNPITLKVENLGNEAEVAKVVNQMYDLCETGQGQQMTIPVIDNNRGVVGLVSLEMLQMMGVAGNRGVGSPQVLVVGGAGYIGSVLVRRLLGEGWRVRVLDSMLYKQTSLDDIKDERLTIMRGDVTNINDVVGAIEGIDALVFLAEIVGDAACRHRPERALKTNYLSVNNMAHLCAYLNINRFIYASSCSVYGGSLTGEEYINEDSDPKPVSHYGRMKILAERAILNVQNPLFSPTILRLATVFGYSYRPRLDLVVNAFAKNAFFNKYIEVFGGDQWRPNVHVVDVAKAIIKVLDAPIDKVSRQIFNVGSTGENHTINDLAGLTAGIFPGIKIKYNKSATDQRNYRVDFSKYEKTIGHIDYSTVVDGLTEMKDVFEKGRIKDPNEPRYSNIEAIKELVRE